MTTHGMYKTRLYSIWHSMRSRCYYNKHNKYAYYGGRGITICKQWNDFKNFYKWAMNNGYKKNLSIDRLNNNKNYKPSNCKWSTQKEQSRNTTRNINITYKGKTQCLLDWSNEFNINRSTLKKRLGNGWTIEEALKLPPKVQRGPIKFNNILKSLGEWSRVVGIDYNVLVYRINSGWPVNKAFQTPTRKKT